MTELNVNLTSLALVVLGLFVVTGIVSCALLTSFTSKESTEGLPRKPAEVAEETKEAEKTETEEAGRAPENELERKHGEEADVPLLREAEKAGQESRLAGETDPTAHSAAKTEHTTDPAGETGLTAALTPERQGRYDTEQRLKELHEHLLQLVEEDDFYLDDDFSLNRLAEKLATNKSYASKVVNDYMGMTIPQLRNELRLKYAMRQIDENPGMKVSELVAICGYSNGVTFEREFKKRYHCTPSDYIRGVRTARALGHSEYDPRTREQEP